MAALSSRLLSFIDLPITPSQLISIHLGTVRIYSLRHFSFWVTTLLSVGLKSHMAGIKFMLITSTIFSKCSQNKLRMEKGTVNFQVLHISHTLDRESFMVNESSFSSWLITDRRLKMGKYVLHPYLCSTICPVVHVQSVAL